MIILDAQIKRLMKIDDLINQGFMGTVKEYGNQLGCSERTVYVNVEILNHFIEPFGVTATYNKYLKMFQYTRPGSFSIVIKWEDANTEPYFCHFRKEICPRSVNPY